MSHPSDGTLLGGIEEEALRLPGRASLVRIGHIWDPSLSIRNAARLESAPCPHPPPETRLRSRTGCRNV